MIEFTSDWFSSRIPRWKQLLPKEVNYLEIGVHEGRSLLWMLNGGYAKTATAVDLWPRQEIEDRFDNNLIESGFSDRVTKIKGYSHIVLRTLPLESYDLIYVDGNHEGMNVLEDGVLSYRLLRKGGLLIFDDYLWKKAKHHQPSEGVDAFLSVYDMEVIYKRWQVILRK